MTLLQPRLHASSRFHSLLARGERTSSSTWGTKLVVGAKCGDERLEVSGVKRRPKRPKVAAVNEVDNGLEPSDESCRHLRRAPREEAARDVGDMIDK